MTSIIEETDYDIVVIEDPESELTCELVQIDKTRCTRAAYVSAQLSKPCGHFNAGFLLCQPCWNRVISGDYIALHCGRCKQPFDLKPCIVSWDLV